MDSIDAILYINLNNREDRKKSILYEIEKIGFKLNIVHRIPAIYNEQCGHIGCGLSHISALELCIKNNWNRVIIFEDDFHFNVNKIEFDSFIHEADQLNWDVLLLAKGSMHVKEKIGNLQKIDDCTTTSGYIVQKNYFITLQNNFKESIEIMKKELEKHIQFYKDPFITIGNEFEKISIPENFRKNSINKYIIRYGTPSTYWIEKMILSTEFEASNDFFGGDPEPGRLKMVQIYDEDIKPVIPKFIHGVSAIDIHWVKLQKMDNFYIRDPVIGYQGGFKSDTF